MRTRTESTPRRPDSILDAAGAVLAAALAGWVTLSSALAGGEPLPLLGLLLLLAGVYALARLLTLRHGWVAPLLVAMTAAGVAVVSFDDLLARPLGGPLGYSNATGSFFMLAAAAALLVALRTRPLGLRLGAGVVAVAFAAVPWLNGTDTAAALSLLLPLAALAGRRGRRGARAAVVAAAVLAGGALFVTVVVGATYHSAERDGALDRLIDATLTERRAQLWHDALVLLVSNPVSGIGPGNFAAHSPTALVDRDAAWAHHELLQLGAETGAPGLVLGLALVCWAFVRLWWADDAGTAVAAVALGAVVVHSSVDYVLHFPAVGAAAAALGGAGSALSIHRQRGRHVAR